VNSFATQGQSLAVIVIAVVLIATQTIDVDSLRESSSLMGPWSALVLLWPVVTAVDFCQVWALPILCFSGQFFAEESALINAQLFERCFF
jgi:hypothetical protein